MDVFRHQIVTILLGLLCVSATAQNITESLTYRALGPYRAGSWISAIAVPEGNQPQSDYTFFIGARHGGVWKTENRGITFFPVFDSTEVMSIGDIAIAKTNPEIVWVGTGEASNARSSHSGKGVYKSDDGGKSWVCKGLEDSQHISKVIIHPKNPQIVWVAAMGHLFSPNDIRGIFKTTDGGESWEKVLYIDENTGVIDMIINPENPNILYASTYEKYRLPWHYEAGGNNSDIFKSIDGGENWTRLANGLPDGKLGRIGLALCYSKPEIVYAVIENLNPKPGVTINESVGMNHLRDSYFDQMIGGELYRSSDNGQSWEKRNDTSYNLSAKAAYSFNKIMVASDNPDIVYVSSDLMMYSEDGGKTWPDYLWPPTVLSAKIFGDHRCMWMDPKDGRHLMFGSDGGAYESFDRGKTFIHHENIPLGGIYSVETDNAFPYNIYFGLQDHEVWKGPSNSWSGEIGPEDWVITGMWDGMYTKVDPQDCRWLYTTTQFGSHLRVDQFLGERVSIEPKAPEGTADYRFCWTTPLELSPHNPRVIYTGGQMLLRSPDRGNSWEEISPDLTSNDAEKIAGKGHMMYCSITTISESTLQEGLIWVGTDDGHVWATLDNGATWQEFTADIENCGGKAEQWVSRVLASPHQAGKAFVCKSGYRSDDFRAMVFKTTDFGQNWTNISAGLPEAPVNVIAEDPQREGLLYLGNDQGVFISFDDGDSWQAFKNNMPAAPVKDLKIHPQANDLVVGTYGRGGFITDTWPLQHFSPDITEKPMHLFPIESKPQRNYSQRALWGNYEHTGDNYLRSPNEPNGLAIYYFLKETPASKAWLQIFDAEGHSLDTLSIDQQKGFHLVYWDTQDIEPGKYLIRLITGKQQMEQSAEILVSPIWPVGHGPWYKKAE